MNSQEFCYWLQGFFELCPDCSAFNKNQVQTIRNHLSLVFVHDIDPKTLQGKESPEQYNTLLQNLHDGGVKPPLSKPPSKPSEGFYRC